MKRFLLVMTLLAIPISAFATKASSGFSTWPQRGYDSQKRGSISYDLGYLFENGVPLVLKGPVEGLAVSGDKIIANLGNKTVVCVSKDGQSIWGATLSSRAYGAPAIYGNDAVLACENGNTVKFDIGDGKKKWDSKIADSLTTEVTVYGRLGFIGTKSGIICIDMASGTMMWSKETVYQIQTPSASSGFVLANFVKGMSCFAASTGAKFWEIKSTIDFIGCPVIDEDRLFVGTNNGYLKCLSLWDGKELWQSKRDYTAAIPTVSKDKIYFPGKGLVTCLNKTDGKMVWSAKVGKEIVWAQIIKSGDHLVVGGTDSNAYILKASSGKQITSLPIATSVSVQMAVGNGFVALPDLKQRLFIYRSKVMGN